MAGDGVVHGLDINPGMLATAAALASQEGRSIGWYEAPAESMPLPDDVYDVVICSMGIMFFTDLAGGLAEMVRVAKPGGMVVATVFAAVEQNPYMAAQAGRLDEFIEVGAAQLLAHACRLGRDDLVAAFDDLPVTDITADTVERAITILSLVDYLAVHIGGLPYAASFQALPDEERRVYAARVEQDLNPYRTSDGGFETPFALHFVSATVASDTDG
jgi:SAM-dependent methyltransferase